jgi:hypothetical protein
VSAIAAGDALVFAQVEGENGSALAEAEVKPPKGLQSRFMTVAKIDKDNIELIIDHTMAS